MGVCHFLGCDIEEGGKDERKQCEIGGVQKFLNNTYQASNTTHYFTSHRLNVLIWRENAIGKTYFSRNRIQDNQVAQKRHKI